MTYFLTCRRALAFIVSLLCVSAPAFMQPADMVSAAQKKSAALLVTLLPEMIDRDLAIDDMPVLVDGRLRVSYACACEKGLDKARWLYRVHLAGEKVDPARPWMAVPLLEITPNKDAGPFDPKTGVFANTKFDQQAPFHAVAPDRKVGGGRVFVETKTLIDNKGMIVKLRSGDRIEHCIEVYALPHEAGKSPLSARSQTRITAVMTQAELLAWLTRVSEEDRRIKELQKRQKDLFK